MFERALWARNEFIKNPQSSQYDDDALIWCYCDKDKLWYSILGNYSHSSPLEKRKYKEEFQKKIETAAKEIYDDIYFRGKIRIAVLERDNYTCQNCFKKGDSKFHIHHILKKREDGEDTEDNLITVCPTCHKLVDTKLYNPQWV